TYNAGRLFVQAGLEKDDSLFTPGQAIWSAEVIGDLYTRFVDQPDMSSDPFDVKFQRQLSSAPADTYQLAAELLYVHFLIASNIGGDAKRRIINQLLSWSPTPVTIPHGLSSVLDHGLVDTGVAFNTY